ncbi:putative transcriptional regulator [Butyrivibrio fibrisolvens]|uniref:Putative transcriptional regulator n=1 Tax=Butyrivibrio fibrisolvens TaxID=831 RepID=A0A1H9VGX8_BUTFI|nr:helix-turn-helix domain-containing protein [Butyrivibrio fibrisolvens]SES20791.1 putative transcriptional regulator [Butyrivibrio fibrisolvens]
MSTLFDDLKEGLQEAIDFEQGNGKAKTVTFMIEPVKKYSNEDIKRIRNKAGMTQSVFANYMGVSPKTVEAWELGRTHPTGPAYRLLDILAENKEDTLSFIRKC